MSAELAPGFHLFLVVISAVVVGTIALGLVGVFAAPAPARRARTVNRYVLLCLLALVVLFPIYITVVNSLLPSDKIAARPPTLFPTHALWRGYSQAWTQGHVASHLFNSFVVT